MILLVAGLAAAIGVAGCEDDNDAARDTGVPTTMEDVERETGEALSTAAEYFRQKKDQFVAKSQEQLADLERRFKETREQSREAGGRADERLEDLRVDVSEKLARAREELADLQQAGVDKWDDATDEFRDAMEDLKESYNEFVQSYQRQRREDVARG